MISFRQYLTEQFLTENYKNLIGPESRIEKEAWADQVWEMLQKSYAPIGGIKGSGFSSKEDMINNIPFWKLYVKNGKVIVVVLYKDKSGRKIVALGADGSDFSKEVLSNILKSSLKVSYSEMSGPFLGFLMKIIPFDELKKYILTIDQVKKLTGDILTPVTDFTYKSLDEKDKKTYDRFEQLRNYFYIREIGNKNHLKISIGTPNLQIFGKN